MADAVAQLARIGNGWVVAVGGGEQFYPELEAALEALKAGAESYVKYREAAEKEAAGGAVLTPKDFARTMERGRRR